MSEASTRLSREDLLRLKHKLVGSCDSVQLALSQLDLEAFEGCDMEDQLLDVNVEPCAVCGWWFESHDLEPDVNPKGPVCTDCT